MCLNPQPIKNRRLDFRPGVDQSVVYVPCGHCAECQQQKVDSWFVRLFYEREKLIEKGGNVYFPTFTYNSYNVPECDLSDCKYNSLKLFAKQHGDYKYKLPSCRLQSFDKRTVQNALKKLRTRFDREFGEDFKFKYFIVTEYGSDENHLHLPHYHALIYLPNVVFDEYTLKSYLEYAWSYELVQLPRYDCKTWSEYVNLHVDCFGRLYNNLPDDSLKKHVDIFVQSAFDYFRLFPETTLYAPYGVKQSPLYLFIASKDRYGRIHIHMKRGNVSYSYDNEHGVKVVKPIIESSAGLYYVLKYFNKDSFYLNNSPYRDLKNFLSQFPSPGSDDFSLLNEDTRSKLVELYDLLPFNLISKGFGMSLVDDIKLREDWKSKLDDVLKYDLVKNKITIEQDLYSIPDYIVKKIMYDEVTVNRFNVTLLHDGREVVELASKKRVLINELGMKVLQLQLDNKVFNLQKTWSKYLSDDFLNLLSHCDFNENLKTRFLELHDSKPCVDLRLLAYYKLIFQNLDLSLLQSYGNELQDKDSVINFAKSFYEWKLLSYNDIYEEIVNPPMLDYKFSQQLFMNGYCNNLPIFEGFDIALDYFTKLKIFVGELRVFSKNNEDLLAQKLIDFFNNLKF